MASLFPHKGKKRTGQKKNVYMFERHQVLGIRDDSDCSPVVLSKEGVFEK